MEITDLACKTCIYGRTRTEIGFKGPELFCLKQRDQKPATICGCGDGSWLVLCPDGTKETTDWHNHWYEYGERFEIWNKETRKSEDSGKKYWQDFEVLDWRKEKRGSE